MSTLMVGTQQGHKKLTESDLSPSLSLINHVRVQAALDREHG
jgi:hypothetical protein